MDLFTTPELQDIYRLLDTAQLPTDDVADLDLQHFLACGTPGDVRGIIGLEPLGDVGLLRSLVVASSMQSKGCGQQLVRELELHAQAHGMHTLYLLTTTAEAFFARIGYTV